MAADTEIERILADWQDCKSRRSTMNSMWEEQAELMRPSRLGFAGSRSPGDDRITQVYDGEQIDAAKELADSLEALAMPPHEPWLEASTEGELEADDDDLREWLAEAGKRTHAWIYQPRAGFRRMIRPGLNDIAVFGACAWFAGAREDRTSLRFQSIHLRDLHWLNDVDGRSETTFYHRSLSPAQAVQAWPRAKWSREFADKMRDEPHKARVSLLHVVTPRWIRNPRSRRALDMSWRSLVIECETKHLAHEGGLHDNPYGVTELDPMEEGDLWSPGRRAMPDARVLQQIAKTFLRQGHKRADPPTIAIADGIIGPLRLTPGADNRVDPTAMQGLTSLDQVARVLDVAGDVGWNFDMIQAWRQKVGNAFRRQVMTLPDRANMTATEVLRRNQDFVRLLTSDFAAIETGLSERVVELAFQQLMRWSIEARFGPGSPLPLWPETLQEQRVKFKFLSPVARASKAAMAGQLGSLMEILVPLAQAKPEILDWLDCDDLMPDLISNMLGARYATPKDRVQEIRTARQQAVEEEAEVARGVEIAKGAGAAAPALKLLQGGQEAAA